MEGWGTGRAAVAQHVEGRKGVTRSLLVSAEDLEFLHHPEDAGQGSPGDFPYHCLH